MSSELNQKQKERSLKDQVHRILLEEVLAYDYLSETVTEKKDAIVANDFEKVMHLSGVEQVIVNKANGLAKSRDTALRSYLQMKGKSDQPVSMTTFLDVIEPEEKQDWTKLNQRLMTSVKKVQRMNNNNRRLIKVALNYIHGMINLFYPKESGPGIMYDREGKDTLNVATKNLLNCNV